MNVILLEKVGRLGNVGDVANVKAGYARNYLFPFGIAIAATKQNLAEFETRREELMAVHNAKVATALARAKKINGLSLTITANASEEGKLFGSVGTKEIAEVVNAAGGDTDKREVQLPHGVIRETGTYEITLDLGYDVDARISLAVVAEGGGGKAAVAEANEEAEAKQE